jgi:hypothetical protein
LTLVDAEGEHGGSGDEAEAAADGEQAADSGGVTVENAATQDDVDSANREIFVTAGTTGTGLPLATARPWSADPVPPPCQGLAATAVTVGLPLRRWRRSRSLCVVSGPA